MADSTVWYGLLSVGLCVLFVLTVGIGIVIAWLPLGIVSLWFVILSRRGGNHIRGGGAAPTVFTAAVTLMNQG